LVIKTLDPDWIRVRIRIHLKCWIRSVSLSGFNESGSIALRNTLIKEIFVLVVPYLGPRPLQKILID